MTAPATIVGATVYVTPLAPFDATIVAAFESLTFTQVRGVRVIGTLAKQYQTATFTPLAGGLSRQRRVGRAPQSLQLDLYRINDPGQALLRAAIEQDAPYSFRIVVKGIGDHFFTARASNRALGLGSATDTAATSLTLEVETEILEPI
jgi:archaellum component FlaG (FlaF/FlaG flagellin family)